MALVNILLFYEHLVLGWCELFSKFYLIRKDLKIISFSKKITKQSKIILSELIFKLV